MKLLMRQLQGISPRRYVILAVFIGVLAGVGGFTLFYAEGFSYLRSEPEVCANCHIMHPQYDSWLKSGHHGVARCVDCHLPTSFFAKYYAKADNGYRHARGFTLQNFHEPIMITPKNSRILQERCISCHGDFVHELLAGATTDPDSITCVHCHIRVGHGEKMGLGGPDRFKPDRKESL